MTPPPAVGRVTLRARALFGAGCFAAASLAACAFDTSGLGLTGSSGKGGASSGASVSTGGAVTAGTGGSASSASGSGGMVPVFPYAYRRRIVVQAQASPVPTDYSVAIVIDHGLLVSQTKSQPGGDDVRVYRDDAGTLTELDRRLDPVSAWGTGATQIWFRTRAPIAAAAMDPSYWVYYGNATATAPPTDGNKVYLTWSDFDDGVVEGNGWTLSPIGSATGSATEAGGTLTLTVASGDIWNQTDSFLFLHHDESGDFVADARIVSMGGSIDTWAKMGGVMLRQSTDPQSRNRIMSPVLSAKARTNSFRLTDGASTDEVSEGGSNPTPEYERVTRLGDRSRAFHSTDAQTWSEDGAEITFAQALVDPVMVGIPACTLNSAQGTVSVDWFRARKLVAAEPSTQVLAEEAGPF